VVEISESDPVDESFSLRLGLWSGVLSLSFEPDMLSSPNKVEDELEDAQDSTPGVNVKSGAGRIKKRSPSLSFYD
jgi:hypothetical protein